jgi:hypothetical protein
MLPAREYESPLLSGLEKLQQLTNELQRQHGYLDELAGGQGTTLPRSRAVYSLLLARILRPPLICQGKNGAKGRSPKRSYDDVPRVRFALQAHYLPSSINDMTVRRPVPRLRRSANGRLIASMTRVTADWIFFIRARTERMKGRT